MKFSEWIVIRENQINPIQSLIGGGIKTSVKKKDTTVDNIRSVLMKSKNPKMASKQVAQIYDNKMKSSTDPTEIADASRSKSDILTALNKR
jgi:hypothetical protein